MQRRILVTSFLISGGLFLAQSTPQSENPGSLGKGTVLLPNGWKLAPAGRHIQLDDLPLEMVESRDGRYLVVTNSGYSPPILSVVDVERNYVLDRVHVDNAWLGLVFSPDGKKLYSSEGGASGIGVFAFEDGKLRSMASLKIPRPAEESFVGGLSISPDGTRLYAVQILGNALAAIDSSSGKILKSVPLDAEPYTSLVSSNGKSLFVSMWGAARVLELNAEDLELRGTISVGEHPNAMVLSPDGNRLFVSCANTNSVWIIDLKKREAEEQVSVALYPQAPVGTTPCGLGLSPDGKTLLVANSDNNAVAVVDVSRPQQSSVQGFIPTGWYPTAARFSRDGRHVYILSGKGLTSVANPRGPDDPNYIGELLLGTLSKLDPPDSKQLETYTKTVYELTPYSDAFRLSPAHAPDNSPIPQRVGAPSPIRHVFYILRENRTYDQVFGDIPEGNGDPNLCLLHQEVTPNAHALAREFVLFDNFYVDAEVSADGHAFSMGAYANDFIEKTWPMNYAGRGGKYLTDGKGILRNPYGNIAAPPRGYIWDAAKRAGVSVRSYGEFVHRSEDEDKDPGWGPVQASVPGLVGLICPDYPPWNLKIPDTERVEAWLKEFKKFEKEGGLPQLSIIYLPNDHTAGTRPGYPTPRAMVAENDLALGRIVETITKSQFWKESAIFVLEDDAQDGPDHVDAHRSVLLAISPYTRRKTVDSTMYTTSGVLRTIELILGMEPMSQYDAAATPLYSAFQQEPVLAEYLHLPPQISLDEKNSPAAFGAKESAAMNFKDPDRIPMRKLNEILWKSIKGENSVMPPPVRAAFIHPIAKEDEGVENQKL